LSIKDATDAVVQLDLLVDVVRMNLDRSFRDRKLGGNILVSGKSSLLLIRKRAEPDPKKWSDPARLREGSRDPSDSGPGEND
jgi:hypothetical protein